MMLKPYPKYKDSGAEWLGDIPDEWELSRLKRLFSIQKRDPRESDDIVTAFRDGTVTLRKNRREEGFTNALQEIGYQGVKKDDLVIHSMDAFAGAIGVSDANGKSTPVYSVCRAIDERRTFPQYFGSLLRSMALTGYITSLAKGIRERSTDFRWSDAGNVIVPVPSKKTQNKIVSFINYEITRIDSLIKEYEELISLLAEKRQALISHAVTRGLSELVSKNDPEFGEWARPVKFKNSGVEWLGEIPEGWETKALKYVCRMQSGDFINAESISDEGDYPVMGGNGLRGFTAKFNTEGEYPLVGRQGALCGNVNLAHGKFFATEHAVVCYPISSDQIWLFWMLNSMNLGRFNTSAAQPGLSVEVIKNAKTAVPQYYAQKAIGVFLNREISAIDALQKEAEDAIELLKEHRSALITNVVTGKINVETIR